MRERVISVAKLVTVLAQKFRTKSIQYDDLMAAIADIPTVDAVEVVHGRWIFGTANHREYMKCSVCHKSQTPTGVFTYCPNCGAKMDGGNEDG